jgi:anti-sigma factor RsiW
MECELVERLLALNEITPDDRDAVNAHVASCDGCRRAALLYSGISKALTAEPAWHPRAGFASEVARSVTAVPPIWTARNWIATIAAAAFVLAAISMVAGRPLYVQSGVFQNYVAAVSNLGRVLVANAVFFVWGSAVAFVIATAWLTRRWLTTDYT